MRPVAAVLTILALAAPADAFHGGRTFERSANDGGGGGWFFDGSPRFKGYTCAACHVETCTSCHGDEEGEEDDDEEGEDFEEGKKTLKLEITADPATLFEDGRYEPGETYSLRIRLRGEHLGRHARSRIRTFVAEIDTDDARPVGTWSFDDMTALSWDEGRVIAARGIEDQREWTVQVTMPEPGAGRLTLWLAAVSTISGRDDDVVLEVGPLDDEVATFSRSFCEGSEDCRSRPPGRRPEARSPVALGCSAQGGPSPTGGGAILLALMTAALLARPRLRALLALGLSLAACSDPMLVGECRNRVCGDAGSGEQVVLLDECQPVECSSDVHCRDACPVAPEGAEACCTAEWGCVLVEGGCDFD